MSTITNKNYSGNELLIFTATFNENGNIQRWYSQIRNELPAVAILVVDDNSFDGTNEFLCAMTKKDNNLVLHTRESKLGLGTAHLYAYRYALEKKFARLITMDADLSHLPSQLPRFLNSMNQSDFMIGTRWGDGSCNYKGIRKLLSYSANRIARIILKTGLTEYTSSYRSFTPMALATILDDFPRMDNYGFFIETIEILFQNKISFSEVPIDFDDRTIGSSKIPNNQIFVSALLLLRLAFYRTKNYWHKK
jgi:dolichol-phosphate mannosyltransferase